MDQTTDMRPVIKPRSNMLNADDLISGPMTITITKARVNPNAREQPVTINFEGDQGRPWHPCKGVSRLLVQLWGPDSAAYTGKRCTLYRDADVLWAGEAIGGIRISHADGLTRESAFVMTLSGKKKVRITIKPMSDAPEPRQFEPLHDNPEHEGFGDPVAEVRGLIARITGQKSYQQARARLDALSMDMEPEAWRMLSDELELKKQALIDAAKRVDEQ